MRRSALLLRVAPLIAALSIALDGGAEAPAPHPLGRGMPAFEAPDTPGSAGPDLPPEPTGVLRREHALAVALQRSPDLAADAYELRAREGARSQAAAIPNPTLSLELEDFGGSGAFRGVDGAQTTLLLGQRIELGGKRAARLELASASVDLAAWDYEMRRIDLLASVAGAFVDVLAAQERHRLAGEALALARSVRDVAAQRMRAGIASPAEEIRADVAVDVASVELEHTEHELATARQALAATWGGDGARFDRAEGDLQRLPIVPSEAQLADRIEASPSLARWQTERAEREARRARARSERVPDLDVRAGPRRLSGVNETVLVVGVSLPIPLWDRREGAIAESEHRLAGLASEARGARARTVARLANARARLAASVEEASLLRARVIPGAERAVETLRRGYEQGRFSQIEVLDAERARLAAREQYLRTLTEAHHDAQEIERLTGAPLEVRP